MIKLNSNENCTSSFIKLCNRITTLYTEKTIRYIENNQYALDVLHTLSKPQIEGMLKKLYNLEITQINSHRIVYKKSNRISKRYCKKRIIIKLKANQKLPVEWCLNTSITT